MELLILAGWLILTLMAIVLTLLVYLRESLVVCLHSDELGPMPVAQAN